MTSFHSIASLRQHLEGMADIDIAEHSQRFFKTGRGEYGEGDIFLGIRVPKLRALIPACRALALDEVLGLLREGRHEERLLAVLLLVDQYTRAKKKPQDQGLIVDEYLAHTKWINNWDIVDSSAPKLLGAWLVDKVDRSILYTLGESSSIWERRIAVLATLAFIRNNDFVDILALSEKLLNDPHDLIHKATGWMLREMGKRDIDKLYAFLDQHRQNMPRTMLNYATERLPKEHRRKYME